jgi:hypothetical protein
MCVNTLENIPGAAQVIHSRTRGQVPGFCRNIQPRSTAIHHLTRARLWIIAGVK